MVCAGLPRVTGSKWQFTIKLPSIPELSLASGSQKQPPGCTRSPAVTDQIPKEPCFLRGWSPACVLPLGKCDEKRKCYPEPWPPGRLLLPHSLHPLRALLSQAGVSSPGRPSALGLLYKRHRPTFLFLASEKLHEMSSFRFSLKIPISTEEVVSRLKTTKSVGILVGLLGRVSALLCLGGSLLSLSTAVEPPHRVCACMCTYVCMLVHMYVYACVYACVICMSAHTCMCMCV